MFISFISRLKLLLQVPVWQGEGELVREQRLPDGLLLRPGTGGGPGLQDCWQETLPDEVCPAWQESSSNFLSRASSPPVTSYPGPLVLQ